jgi:hypothetical protein
VLAAMLVALTLSACVEFGWDRLSTQVPDAVLDTITEEAIQTHAVAIREAAEPGDSEFVLLDALRYLSRGMAQSGLVAAGESGYLRPVPLRAVRIDHVEFTAGTHEFTQGENLALWSRAGLERLQLHVPLVFVGHGIVAPERDRDDYRELDLDGKVALILTGASDSSYVDTWYADWRYQSAEAVRHGASGVLLVHAEDSKHPDWVTTRDHFARYQFAHATNPDSVRAPLFEAWIPGGAGDEILRSAGIIASQARSAARTAGFRGRQLDLLTTLEATASLAPTTSYNLLGQIPGRYSEDQSILICASLENSPESFRACAATLELARAFRALNEEPARSVVFAIFASDGARDKRMLGAESYLQDPIRELTQCTGALILDGALKILPGTESVSAAGTDTLTAGGIQLNELGRLLRTAASEDELALRNEDDASRWFSSVGPAIAREGLPAATVGCGVSDLRAALRVGFHMSQTRGSPRWDQSSAFRFFPR